MLIYKVRIVQYASRRHLEAEGEAGAITDWYDNELSAAGQAEFDRVLRALVVRSIAEWERPLYGIIKHGGEGFGEIRFKADRKEHRPMGFVLPVDLRADPKVEEFAIVVGAQKKMNVWTPRKALDTAVERIREVRQNGRRRLREYTSHLEI